MKFTIDTKLIRTPDLTSTAVDSELVVLNLATSNYIGLDEIGRYIWEMLEKPYKVEELCQQLTQEFDADLEQIVTDVLAFLEELAQEDMVRVVV